MMVVHFEVVRFGVVHYFGILIQASIRIQVLLFHHLLQTFLRRRYFARRQPNHVVVNLMTVVMAYVKVKIFFEFYNPHIPNIDAISGTVFTLRIQYEYTQTQCDEGTRDGIDIWYMGNPPLCNQLNSLINSLDRREKLLVL